MRLTGKRTGAFLLTLVIAGIGTVLPAVAQEESVEPRVRNFNDWALRCVDNESGTVCSLIQILANAEGREFARLTVRRPQESTNPDAKILRIRTPLGADLVAGLTLQVDTLNIERHVFTVCDATGCYVPIPLNASHIAGFSTAEGGNIIILDRLSGNPITLPLSFNGFAEGLSAFDAEAGN